MSDYQTFLASKQLIVRPAGYEVEPGAINPILFPFQRDVVKWAVRKGRASVFLDTGLGKTFVQLEWARLLLKPGERALIVAPLSVARQTVAEGAKLGIEVHQTRSGDDLIDGINITNYEMLDHFDPALFAAVVLDESSILKALMGKTRAKLTEMFARTPYRLCCTATPAPNDITEIGQHSEFLGIMTQSEMLSAFFINDMKQADGTWRLKRHGEKAFYQWLASWAISMRKPSDLGYDDDGYILPPLNIEPLFVTSDYMPEGQLFMIKLKGIQDRSAVRKGTVEKRVQAVIDLVHSQRLMYNLGNEYKGKFNGQGSEKTIQSPMGDEQQGAYTPISRGDKGTPQCETARALRAGGGEKNQSQDGLEEMATGAPTDAKGSEIEPLFNQYGGIPSANEQAGGEVRDLRILRPEQKELLSSRGSLPQDGQSQGSSVRELQSRSGEIQGQYSATGTSDQIPAREQWIIWCGLNAEQDTIAELLGDECVSVSGGISLEEKEERIQRWLDGDARIIVSKPKVLGFGMNFQNCHNMAFVGLSDSWEAYYQCIRRCYRFGQQKPINVYIVLTDVESEIYENVMHKEKEALSMSAELINHVADIEAAELAGQTVKQWEYREGDAQEDGWRMMLGDSGERMAELDTDSVDLSIFSPPFISLYTYSPTERDMGNCKTDEEFHTHFKFIIAELLRITKPGRLAVVHVQQVAAQLMRDGYIGLKDFRGDVIRSFSEVGFIYHGEVTIDKDPQVQAIRTKSKGLLFAQMHKDSSWSRPGLADYLLIFRKPGDNAAPIVPDVSNDEWILWARPVWYGIRESETLNTAVAKSNEDERHICPLQLGTIERAVRLWSNKGETVFSPFAGIGSEGYEAIRLKRKFIGIELKPEYHKVACDNLRNAERLGDDLFAYAAREGIALEESAD